MGLYLKGYAQRYCSPEKNICSPYICLPMKNCWFYSCKTNVCRMWQVICQGTFHTLYNLYTYIAATDWAWRDKWLGRVHLFYQAPFKQDTLSCFLDIDPEISLTPRCGPWPNGGFLFVQCLLLNEALNLRLVDPAVQSYSSWFLRQQSLMTCLIFINFTEPHNPFHQSWCGKFIIHTSVLWEFLFP